MKKLLISLTVIASSGFALNTHAGTDGDALTGLQKQLERTYPQTTKRPLFRADRRPEKKSPVVTTPVVVQEKKTTPAPVVQQAAYVPPPTKLLISTYSLKGVILNGEKSIVFLEHAATQKTLRLGQGTHEAPGENGDIRLTVEKIEAQSVTLTADQSFTLRLREPGKGIETMVASAPADLGTPAVAQTVVQASNETTIAPLTPQGTKRLRQFAIVAND